jgi:hypothetical protein
MLAQFEQFVNNYPLNDCVIYKFEINSTDLDYNQ